jgi:glycosyltransferase involved in cell wall biosynthesis
MNVAFINENTLGHASYLLPFVRWFEAHSDAGVKPHLLDATPLPPQLQMRADFTVPGLRRWGLDFHNARWRLTVSGHVRAQLDDLRSRVTIDAVVVNTQSVALRLVDVAEELPVFVCLDATFAQLSRSGWFAPNIPSKLLLPVTSAAIRQKEKKLFARAACLVPWSRRTERSLREEYGLKETCIHRLPPSLPMTGLGAHSGRKGERPQLLFLGGDFRRKGGPLLLECFRRHFAGRCELHVVTESAVEPEPGVIVHRGVKHGSPEWRERWANADVFVFPSTLETYGIVLAEALAFGVPVVSADVGAARELLEDGEAGWLVSQPDGDTLGDAIREALTDTATARARAERGRQLVGHACDLETNARKLAGWLADAIKT